MSKQQTQQTKQEAQKQAQQDVKDNLREHIKKHKEKAQRGGHSRELEPDEYATLVQTHLNDELSHTYDDVRRASGEKEKQQAAEDVEEKINTESKEELAEDLIETLNSLPEEEREKVFEAERRAPHWIGQSDKVSMAYSDSQDMLVAQTPHAEVSIRSTTDADTSISHEGMYTPDGDFAVGIKARRETGMEFKDKEQRAKDVQKAVRRNELGDDKTVEDKLREHMAKYGREQAAFTLKKLEHITGTIEEEYDEPFPLRDDHEADSEYLKELEEDVNDAHETYQNVHEQSQELERTLKEQYGPDVDVTISRKISKAGSLNVQFKNSNASLIIQNDVNFETKHRADGNPRQWTIENSDELDVMGFDVLGDSKDYATLNTTLLESLIEDGGIEALKYQSDKRNGIGNEQRDHVLEALDEFKDGKDPSDVIEDVHDTYDYRTARLAAEQIEGELQADGESLLGEVDEDRTMNEVVNQFMEENQLRNVGERRPEINDTEYVNAETAQTSHRFVIDGREVSMSVAAKRSRDMDGVAHEMKLFSDGEELQEPEQLGLDQDAIQETLDIEDEQLENELIDDKTPFEYVTSHMFSKDDLNKFIELIQEQAESHEADENRKPPPYTYAGKNLNMDKDPSVDDLFAQALYEPERAVRGLKLDDIEHDTDINLDELSDDKEQREQQVARILANEEDERFTREDLRGLVEENESRLKSRFEIQSNPDPFRTAQGIKARQVSGSVTEPTSAEDVARLKDEYRNVIMIRDTDRNAMLSVGSMDARMAESIGDTVENDDPIVIATNSHMETPISNNLDDTDVNRLRDMT